MDWTVIGTGVAIVGLIYGYLRNFRSDINDKFKKIDDRFDKIDLRLHNMQQSINDLDKRLYGVETVLHMKDCCVLKQDQNLKKAE